MWYSKQRDSPSVTLPDNPDDYTTELAGYEASPEYSPSYIINVELFTPTDIYLASKPHPPTRAMQPAKM